MNEVAWITIIGLCFDIIGALILVGIIRHSKHALNRFFKTIQEIENEVKNSSHYDEITPQTNREKIDKLQTDYYERQIQELKEIKYLILGVLFLVLGFILQIIGNFV